MPRRNRGRAPAAPEAHVPESRTLQPEPARRPKRLRRRRTRRILLISALITVVLLAALFFLAPVIAGRLAPGYAQRAINGSIAGTSQVQGASLSWWGTQRIGPVVITDDKGAEVANLQIELKRGLLALATDFIGSGPPDLGTARVSGSVRIVRDAEGRTNLE